MAAGDVQVRSAAHPLDQSKFAFFLGAGMFGVLIIGLSLPYLFAHPRKLNVATDMDQAQIARLLSAGNGSSTRYIRPIALAMIQNRQGENTQPALEAFPGFLRDASNRSEGLPRNTSWLRTAE